MEVTAAVDIEGTARGSAQRRILGLLLAVLALATAVVLSIMLGSRWIAAGDVLRALIAPVGGEIDRIVWELRLPRTVAALVVGAALGVAGALVQAFTRNPLGDPGILGVNAGAALGVAIGISVFGTSVPTQHLGFAFAGALLTTLAVLFIGAAGRSADPARMILAGVAVGAVLTGITTAMTLLSPKTFNQMRGWIAGSFVERDIPLILPTLPFIAIGLVVAFGAARSLNAMGLGDDLARALGAHVGRTRILAVLGITLLAGSATAIAGPIAFVGLMVPHVARWIVGPDQRWILPYSAVLAPVLLLLADVVGRVLMQPGEIPVGIVTAFIGAPVLIAFVRRRKASGL